jgi:hypothetical protein
VGPRAGVDRCGKSRPSPGFDLRTVQTRSEYLYRLGYSGPLLHLVPRLIIRLEFYVSLVVKMPAFWIVTPWGSLSPVFVTLLRPSGSSDNLTLVRRTQVKDGI